MGRNVVIWSGGADSTWILDHYAGVSSEDCPVVALSVAGHPFLSKAYIGIQNKVQMKYLDYAKKKGYHVKHEKVFVKGNFSLQADAKNGMGQPLIWLSCLLPCVKDGDAVFLGYIRSDGFWHNRHAFEEAFNSLCKLKKVKADLHYPCEWYSKVDVLRKLKKAKVPDCCWWSCDKPKNGKICGVCSKCVSINEAKKQMRKKGKDEDNKERECDGR